MADALFKQLYSQKNLELAWNRTRTAQDLSYKSYYRELFYAYELSKNENLKNLSDRIKNGSYVPKEPLRIFLPKPSGLQRTISILNLDDIIIYQAIANVLSKKFSEKRQLVENKTVFSNILNPEGNIFFFQRWQDSYSSFIGKIKKYYRAGNRWVAHFDLAAFYDTISQDTLCYLISPSSEENFKNNLRECLKTWSSSPKSREMKQGIPQGPLASSCLCEIYLLDIDLELQKQKVKYVRYVDDIKIFGITREEVLKGIILLDRICKGRGLIPQGKKYEILEIKNISDAIGKSPSLTQEEKGKIPKSEGETLSIFRDAFFSKDMDSSKVKYILKVGGENSKIRRIILGNIHRHPELTDHFIAFLNQYTSDSKLGEYIYKNAIRNSSPYEYVEGKYWELLSKFKLSDEIKKEALGLAISRLKKNKKNFALKLGLYKMIASFPDNKIIKFIVYEESAFLQGLVVPSIASEYFESKEYQGMIKKFLLRSSYEPALLCISQLYYNLRLDLLKKIPFSKKDDSGVINNTLGKREGIDSVGLIIKNRFETNSSNKWKILLINDYGNANRHLILAGKAWYTDRNAWMGYLDSFNDIIFRKLIELLKAKFPKKKWPTLIDKNGKLVKYGSVLYASRVNKVLRKITGLFLAFHIRRSKIPTSHPKDEKTGKSSLPLGVIEQRKYKNFLKNAYIEIISILEKIL